MEESVIYQDILQKGEARGEQWGFERGFERGFEQGFQFGLKLGKVKLIILMLTCRFGTLPGDVSEKIRTLSILQIEELARLQIDFSTIEDVVNWLHAQS